MKNRWSQNHRFREETDCSWPFNPLASVLPTAHGQVPQEHSPRVLTSGHKSMLKDGQQENLGNQTDSTKNCMDKTKSNWNTLFWKEGSRQLPLKYFATNDGEEREGVGGRSALPGSCGHGGGMGEWERTSEQPVKGHQGLQLCRGSEQRLQDCGDARCWVTQSIPFPNSQQFFSSHHDFHKFLDSFPSS